MVDKLDDTGLTIDSYQTRLDRIIATLRSEIDPLLELTETDEVGQIVRIVTDAIQQVANLAQPVYTAYDPSQNSGHSQTMTGLITGSERSSGTHGKVILTLNLDGGTTVPAGKIAGTGQENNQWAIDAEIIAPAGPIADYTVVATCINKGEIVAPAGTIDTIITPVAGWNTVTNASDAEEGEPADNDSLFRQKRDTEIVASGSSSLPSVQGAVSQIDGIEEVTVYQNTRHFVNSLGLPPNSFETVIWVAGGAVSPGSDLEQEIVDTIFDKAPAAIYPTGTQFQYHIDSNNNGHEVGFTVAAPINVVCSITIETVTGYAGDDAVKAVIDEYIDGLVVGSDVRRSGIIEVVEGVQGVDYVELSAGPLLNIKPAGPIASDLTIAYNQKAVVEVLATDITVIS